MKKITLLSDVLDYYIDYFIICSDSGSEKLSVSISPLKPKFRDH